MTDKYTFNPTILREYDIRGIVGDTLNAEDARAVGRAFGTMVVRDGGSVVCVGYDGRHSSPELEAALVEGLVSTGLSVERVGLGPTPMLYFAVKHLGAAAGVMITGSHNPPEYNGIKMTTAKAPVYGSQIQEIGRVSAAGDVMKGQGVARDCPIMTAYIDRILADVDPGRDLTVVWDAGNGSTGEVLRRMTERLPGKHILLFDDIDGDFPNHHPDPTIPENLVSLIASVKEHGADLGIAFDGDGDRIGAVDEKGRVIWGDQLLAIYASDVLKSHPGATIIADVKASQTLFEEIARLGGKPLMWKTGHSLLKAKMAEIGSPLAGEMSGHIFFNDRYYGYDDAPYCGIRLMNVVAKGDEPLSAMRDRIPPVLNTPEIRFQVDETRKFAVVDEVKARLTGPDAPLDVQVNDIDGVRVTTADGWWLLRASNTQDVLVARAESQTKEGLERLKDQIVDQLTASGLPRPDFSAGGH
ncbi:phosphoglucomutase/phosphomannomutase PgmG [Fodinicurvata sp. EGI_FJ10296]|uniref:phosphoglucomutase/phosphomannomutase PgmG n=1 Tax=Fodinicurvata sp. EGI_FJ10296 TaxID=3231908 RepID=UPI003451265B